jgi:hypothetical protein
MGWPVKAETTSELPISGQSLGRGFGLVALTCHGGLCSMRVKRSARSAAPTARWSPSARHPIKSRTWVTTRYFGPFHPTRRNQWVYGDHETGAYLHQYAWTTIVRHVPVTGRNSPDDPALTQYWANRRRKR